jgi:FkbM family methyltransferase
MLFCKNIREAQVSLQHRIYNGLLKTVQANREGFISKKLFFIAKGYRLAYENFNFDFMTNGEYFLASRLKMMGKIDIVMDVGANVGEYSRMIRALNSNCRIIAFEPVPSTFKTLKTNTQTLNIELQNYALGNITGETQISIVPNISTLASLVENMQDGSGRNSEKINISIKRGDNLIKELGIDNISLLKIDTEGYESEVLKGFDNAIEKADVVQFEYGKANLFSKYFLHDYFRDYGDRFFIGKLYPDGVKFFDNYNWDLDNLIGPNYVMVNKSKSDIKLGLEC